MNTPSVFIRICNSQILRRAIVTLLLVTLVGLASCGRKHGSTNDVVGTSEILTAAENGEVEKIKVLLQVNPDLVFSAGDHGQTALHVAALNGRADVAELLLANDAEVDAKAYNGGTPLHCAALMGHKDVVKLLLDHKAAVNAKDKQDNTPSDYAELTGHKDVVALLHQHGGSF
jgi:ankyrin repeat protein